ncbi:hypothetical protein GCM10012287_50370 [Streptomyces daqingensis]|uniref:Secreted protein n=1 Tax=Streptomyces daqingensis TaxID=1472640 RepID=A0ABQ2MRC5_9ACTN|nr:hypothetical protein [Streptomyces daqingensis]GGO56542.1 hypothetical protein GCM10012287_50370 [Streptomyces daqingensis]
MDILVTVGVIVLLIALTALMIHLLNVRHQQSIVTHRYDTFHPGNPPEGEGAEQAGPEHPHPHAADPRFKRTGRDGGEDGRRREG